MIDNMIQSVTEKLSSWPYIEAVSYTHLDVYKRQVPDMLIV